MIANPKPAPRAKRTPRPIKRTPIKRRTVKRNRKTTCVTRGCNRVPTAGSMCLTHAKRKADELWGRLIRKDHCELTELGPCGGPIQACHGFSRGYLGTRWLIDNGFSGCAGHNFFAEVKPLQWDEYLRKRWGPTKYEDMRHLALSFGKRGERVDYTEVIAGLRDKAGNEEGS